MDPLTYLTSYVADFGVFEWVFFIAQIATAVAGTYLAFLRTDADPFRKLVLQRLGYALLVLGVIGVIITLLRLGQVEPFTMPIWMTVVTILDVVLVAYVLYYATSIYPAQYAAYIEANRKSSRRAAARTQSVLQTNGTGNAAIYQETRPVASSSRREARRDRKRKSR